MKRGEIIVFLSVLLISILFIAGCAKTKNQSLSQDQLPAWINGQPGTAHCEDGPCIDGACFFDIPGNTTD